MKILCLSDTHCTRPDIENFPEYDILVHSGDALSIGGLYELNKFIDWLREVRKTGKPVVFVPGNHDFCFENEYGAMSREILEDLGVILLDGQSVEIHGLTFWGAPYCDLGAWAFYRPPDVREAIVNAIPDNLDVLVTHMPATFRLDAARYGSFGCDFLRDRLEELRSRNAQPRLHVHGHVHEARGQIKDWMHTVNAAHRFSDDAFVVDLQPRK